MTSSSRRLFFALALLAFGLGGGTLRADPPKPTPPAGPAAAPAVSAADPALALQKALQVEQSLIDALAKVRRFSVSVLVSQKDREGRLQVVGGGSGVLVSKSSAVWVITNVHVVKDASAIEVVTYDGTSWPMEVADQVAQYDIALLRFKDKPKGLKGVDVKSGSSQKLSEGAWVLATGNPFLLAVDGQPVCTLGVISGTDRVLPSDEFLYNNAIQHDAEVNPGNSGGPLWNAKGDLIGINGKINMRPGTQGTKQNTGASFAIPIHLVAGYLDTLVKDENARAGYLGVVFETFIDEKTGSPAGAKVLSFQPNSPATGGTTKSNPNSLQRDDVIQKVTFSGKSVTVLTAADLTNALVLYPAETKVTITYKRGPKTFTWSGTLAGRG